MKRHFPASLVAVLAAVSFGCAHAPQHQTAAPAAGGDRFPSAFSEDKEGRDNLTYLREGENFYVVLRSGSKCQITDKVDDFKMLPRGNHVLAYETKDGELIMLRLGDDEAGQCYSQKDRKTDVTDQQARVLKWNVVSAADQPVVLVALDKNGFVKMYDSNGNEKSGLAIRNVEDYRLHPCHGKSGVPFNSKLLFAYGNGRVMTISPEGKAVLDQRAYSSASDFIEKNKVDCSR